MAYSSEKPVPRFRPNKLMGQNFLSDSEMIERIADAAHIAPADTILEIGPGFGALTFELAARGERVIAIEKDGRLAETLRAEIINHEIENISVIQGDILEMDPDFFTKISPYAVVANIPYYLTARLFRKLLEETASQPASITVTIQKEVAERITAKPPEMSVLALSVQAYGDPEICFPIPKSFFTPQPKVDSAVIRVSNISKDKFASISEKTFFSLIRAAFGKKRKQLVNALASRDYPKAFWESHLPALHISPNARPEDLTLENWLSLARLAETSAR